MLALHWSRLCPYNQHKPNANPHKLFSFERCAYQIHTSTIYLEGNTDILDFIPMLAHFAARVQLSTRMLSIADEHVKDIKCSFQIYREPNTELQQLLPTHYPKWRKTARQTPLSRLWFRDAASTLHQHSLHSVRWITSSQSVKLT